MRTWIFISALLLLASPTPQTTPAQKTKFYHKLEDGNQLYSDCQAWHRNMVLSGHRITFATNNPQGLYGAGACWGYVLGVVDSIPTGEGFEPASTVRASQYIDVVTDYLRDHPELRDRPAYLLAREALSKAFP
jgi:hypothetical protein